MASDFLVVVTARFRVLYVFVVMEVGTRKIVHFNVTDHPTADWTLQQFREVTMEEQPHRFVIHDRDSIYSPQLDSALKAMGLRVLKTPFQAPQAKGRVERIHGTHQDRLVKTMRRKQIHSHAAANVYLEREYLVEHNRRFARAAARPEDYHRGAPRAADLDRIFRLESERTVSGDWVVR